VERGKVPGIPEERDEDKRGERFVSVTEVLCFYYKRYNEIYEDTI